jgi:hypothetical protein
MLIEAGFSITKEEQKEYYVTVEENNTIRIKHQKFSLPKPGYYNLELCYFVKSGLCS